MGNTNNENLVFMSNILESSGNKEIKRNYYVNLSLK